MVSIIRKTYSGISSEQEKEIRERILRLRERIAQAAEEGGRKEEDVSLMAVTKTVDPERVNIALDAGVSLLGENRAQELMEKNSFYTCEKSRIHFIGHLQSNKIRDIINRVSCVESVDSLHLASALSAQAEKAGIIMPCLLEVNIGQEESKSGFSPEGVLDAAGEIAALPNLSLRGLMLWKDAGTFLSPSGKRGQQDRYPVDGNDRRFRDGCPERINPRSYRTGNLWRP